MTAQLAADLLPTADRVRHLPALGFLGLGPWYYDNGAVEITRADERHDRVDAVSRGFLGLTVGCARCHDHKYDPIPTTDYYALARRVPQHRVPRVSAGAEGDRRGLQGQGEGAQAEARDARRVHPATEARQLADTLAFETAKYMKAAWQVTGEPKKDKAEIIERDKLDYELFERWLAFLSRSRPPSTRSSATGRRWSPGGGTAKEADDAGDAFQELVIGVVLEEREVKKENDIIKARALPTAKPKEPANLPNEFKTNDDFCPGCGLELRSMSTERTALWTRRVRRRPRPTRCTRASRTAPGLLRFRGWGLEQRLGGDRRALDRGAAQGHRGDGEGAAAEVRLRARRPRPRDGTGPARCTCAATRCASATRCRAASSRC